MNTMRDELKKAIDDLWEDVRQHAPEMPEAYAKISRMAAAVERALESDDAEVIYAWLLVLCKSKTEK